VALVANGLNGKPYCGDVFVFRSKRADRLKILAFDGTGMILATKWLEEGRFAWPPIKDGTMRVTAAQLAMLVEGLGEWIRIVPKAVKRVRRNIAAAKDQIEYYGRRVEGTKADQAQLIDTTGDKFHLAFNETTYTERKKAGEAIIKATLEAGMSLGRSNLGSLGGFDFAAEVDFGRNNKKITGKISIRRNCGFRTEVDFPDNVTALGLISRLEWAVSKINDDLSTATVRLEEAQHRLVDYEPRLGASFDLQGELNAKMQELVALEQDLANTKDGKQGEFDELDEIANLFAGRHVPYVERPETPANDDEGGEGEEMAAAA
jgi:transposase